MTKNSGHRNINLRSIDIGVLMVFDAVMKDRSVTRAAHRLHMSQPAVSSAINKLRSLLNDQLFVRIPGGIRPTPRASELASPIQCLLSQVQKMFEPSTFFPATETRTFKLALSEHCATLILPRLTTALSELAPKVRLKVLQKKGEGVPAQLTNGDIDMAIGTFVKCPHRVYQTTLFTDSYICVTRRDHPLASRMSPEDFLDARHLLVSPTGALKQPIDTALGRRGLERNVVMTINQLSLAPPILERTDLVLTTHKTLANHAGIFRGLCVQSAPFDLEPVRIRLLWHTERDSDAASLWLRQKIVQISREFRKSVSDIAESTRAAASQEAQRHSSVLAPDDLSAR